MNNKKRPLEEESSVLEKKDKVLKTNSDKEESKLRKHFRRAIAWVIGDDVPEESVNISEEDQEEIRVLAHETQRALRSAYEAAIGSIYGAYGEQMSGFTSLGTSNVIELKYEEYVDFNHYVQATFSKDLEFYIAYKKYVDGLNVDKGGIKTFKDNVHLRRVMSDFRGDSVQKYLLMAIFDGQTDLTSWIVDSDKLMKTEKSLRKKIILNLISRPIITANLFMSWFNGLPKKFINTEERAELLMDYAVRNTDKPDTGSKHAQDFILHEENKNNPYR